MTFEEWFEQEFVPSFAYSGDDPYRYASAARRAWNAAWDAARDEGFVDGVAEGRAAQ